MKTQTFNPYLPSWEYVPDGEPHVFGDRVYVYGSHDAFGAPIFCVKDYICWSAPVNDLSDWRYEGVIYRKNQDPRNPLGLRCLYAPDVTRGPDGRYYLYYAFDFLGEIGVAVCDTPAGQYRYYGKVRHKNGTVWGRKSGEQFPFDPAVLMDDDGKVWLYSGFATKVPRIASGLHDLRNDGGTVMELEPDMVTIRQEPKVLFPTKGKPGAFPHAFFEASSIRKVGKKYCFVYSSEYNHDLCYAMSDYPDRGFVYGGVLVDLGDLFLWGNTDETRADNYLGNTHGGLPYFCAYMIAMVIGECINFTIQRNFVFRSKGNLGKQIAWYVLAFCVITCIVNSINCVWVAVAGLFVPDFIYNIGTTVLNGGVSMVIFFFVNKIIFPERGE